jgi:hypothetical protein
MWIAECGFSLASNHQLKNKTRSSNNRGQVTVASFQTWRGYPATALPLLAREKYGEEEGIAILKSEQALPSAITGNKYNDIHRLTLSSLAATSVTHLHSRRRACVEASRLAELERLYHLSKVFCNNGRAQPPGEPLYEHSNITDAARPADAPYRY